MKLTSSSDSAGLVEDINFICQTNATSYPLADKVRNMNRWIYPTVIRIIRASSRWKFDDDNNSGLPTTTDTLVDTQQAYTLPTDLLKLDRVEVLDNNGNSHKLIPIDTRDISQAIPEFLSTNGLPRYYDVTGDSIRLFPAPAAADVTTTNGLIFYYTRDVDQFTTVDTTQEPGFAEPFHRVLSLGASYDWFISQGEGEKATQVRGEIEALYSEISVYYGTKNEEDTIRIRPAHRTKTYE